MRPAQVVRRAAAYLERHDVDAPLATAEQLLASVLDTDRAGLYGRAEPLHGAEAKAFGSVLCKRCAGTPTQHLTGEAGFRHLVVTVRPGVFVPRPETEVVVDVALEVVRDVVSPLIVDVCTGSGVIALAIKHERADATVWAIDLSFEAVALARENAIRNGLDIEVVQGDMLDDLPRSLTGSSDMVVANPPYIEPGEYRALPREVRADPVEALVGGIPVYERLFTQARSLLRPGGSVVVEIGAKQAESVGGLAIEIGAIEVSVHPDLAGRDRVVVATWP